MLDTLVLFGATGDLAGRFLLPGLAVLAGRDALPHGFSVIGSSPEPWDDARLREHAEQRLRLHAGDIPAGSRERVTALLHHRPADVTDPSAVARVIGHPERPVAVYLALPGPLVAPAVRALQTVPLPAGSRLVVEKPFGHDLRSATELNALLAGAGAGSDAGSVYRVDHALGLVGARDLLRARRTDPALGAIWDGRHIAEIEVGWEETLALEGRASFYDSAGALKDVVQNHVLQVLALVCQQPPSWPGEPREQSTLEVLRALRVVSSVRARYTAGRLSSTGGADGRPVPAYADEAGVDASRGTETFVELVAQLSLPRWAGTRIRLRAGKALQARRRRAVLHLRSGGQLVLDLDDPERSSPPLRWRAASGPAERAAYVEVLADVLGGGSALAISGEEAEQAWRVVEPVLTDWAAGRVPLLDYPAGSAGPAG